jgi:DNA (cytosine-5)-methyltransferase 1
MNELALFAGSGGGILGGHLLGWRTVAAVEIEDYPRRVLLQRQADGLLPRFPIWDDICTFDGHPWRGKVDVISGGFPCQDISAAGKGDGLDGERSGLWTEMARLVGEIRPPFVFVENSPMLTSRGGVRVIADLTSLGYDCRWTVIGAADVGAPHQRDRIWIVAQQRNHANSKLLGWEERPIVKGVDGFQDKTNKLSDICETQPRKIPNSTSFGHQVETDKCLLESEGGNKLQPSKSRNSSKMGDSQGAGLSSCVMGQGQEQPWRASIGTSQWWETEPELGRVADGVANRVDRLKAIGNGQVPLCAATAWRLLTKDWELML